MAFRRAFAASTLAFLAMLVIQSDAGMCTCTCVAPQSGLQVDVISCFLPGACDDCAAKCTAASTTLQESTCEMDGKEYGIYAAIVAALLIIPTVFTICVARHRRKQSLPNTCGRMTAHWFGCFLLDIVWIPFCCCIERKGGSSDSGDRMDSRTELAPSGKGKSKKTSDEANLDKTRSKDIDRAIQIDQRADMEAHKLLLLGAGESGKSTLFKQMITIYGKGFPEAERKTYKSVVMGNILASIKTLVQQSDHFGPVAPDLAEAKQAVEDQAKDDIDEKLGGLIMALWKDPGIQTTYDNRSKFQLTDSTAYFFERLPEVCKEGYVPSEQDVLRSRVRTTGIVENEFHIDGNQFKMYDVGGQRNERKKWIHCFENVTAVLFVAAISEYDQYLYEDENTNRMHEALNLFDSICNSKWFGKTSFILFLNKSDLFAEKIQKVPITTCFPDYKGEQAYEPSVAYIEQQFQDLNKNKDKKIYVHVTCATDTTLIRKVFHAVKDIVLRNALGESGLA